MSENPYGRRIMGEANKYLKNNANPDRLFTFKTTDDPCIFHLTFNIKNKDSVYYNLDNKDNCNTDNSKSK